MIALATMPRSIDDQHQRGPNGTDTYSRLSELTTAQNHFWSEYGYHRGQVTLKNLPEVVAIESTNFCNLKCIMCPRGEPDVMERAVGHMKTDLFEKILDQLVFFEDPCRLHWFGEPLMNPKIFEQIAIAKRRVPNLAISTNATLLHEENSARLLDSGLDTLMVAIDGATADVYESIRKSPTFTFEEVTGNTERFLEMKRRLGRHKPRVILSIIKMRDTEGDLEDFRAHWLAKGADEIRIKPFVAWGSQEPGFADLAMQADAPKYTSTRAFPCKFLWQNIIIAWDGLVVPCCYDYDAKMVMGDLKTSSLAEIWNSPKYVEFRRAELEGRNLSPLCANCADAPGHARNPNWGAEGSRQRKRAFPAEQSFWKRLAHKFASKEPAKPNLP
jgi:radical SAM protein with 4Fe4S-binding SPASM domain